MRIRCACFSTRHRGAAFAYLTSAAVRSGRIARPPRVRIGAFIQSGDILTVSTSPEDPGAGGGQFVSRRGRNPSHQKGGVNSSTSGGVGCGSEWRGAANSSGGVGCGSEWRGAANSSGFDRIPVRVGRGSQEHVRKNKFAQVSKLVYDCAADHKQVITNLTSYPTSTFIQTSLRGSLLRRASGTRLPEHQLASGWVVKVSK